MRSSSIFSFILFLLIASCQQKVQRATRLLGNIKEAKDTWIYLHESGKKIDSTKIESNGNFELDSINDAINPNISLSYQGEKITLFLEKNSTTKISLNANDFSNDYRIKTGDKKVQSAKNQIKGLREVATTFFNNTELYTVNKKAFQKELDSIFEQQYQILDDENLDLEYLKYERKNIDYDKAKYLLSYFRKAFYSGNSLIFHSFRNLKSMISLEQTIEAESMIDQEIYTDFIRNFLKTKILFLQKEQLEFLSPKEETKFAFSLIENTFESPKIKDILLQDYLMNFLWMVSLEESLNDSKDIFERYFAHIKNPKYKKQVQSIISRWDKISPRKEAPNFSFKDIYNQKHSLSDYKGKYIYLTIWSSWCGVCSKEIENWSKLKAKYKNSEIVFLSVCLDTDENEWRKWLRNTFDDPEGHLIASKGWNEEIVNDYLVYKFPRFIMIDPKGLILNPEEKSPSEDLEKVIIKLKEKDLS